MYDAVRDESTAGQIFQGLAVRGAGGRTPYLLGRRHVTGNYRPQLF
jgi:hypothetical protein